MGLDIRTRGSVASIALGLAGFLASAPATAQSSPGEDAADSGTVVVVGRRSTETTGEQIKRAAAGIVDSTTASQIENSTDTTLPEALDRVVGVSSDKFYGTSDAGYVSIRGFDSRYNSMDIDGNPIWFSSQNNRGAQMGMFPAAIVKETSVHKTVTPDQDGNSVGGRISMRTLRAFDGGDRPYLSLGGRVGGYEQDSVVNSGLSTRFYGAGKATFGADHRFGIVLGFNSQRMRNADTYGGVDTYAQVNGEDQVASSNIYNNSIYDKIDTNNALYAKLEAQASDRLYAFISGNLFDDSRRQYLDRAAVYVYNTNGRTTNFNDGSADFTGAIGQTKEYDYYIKRKAKVMGSGLDYRLSDSGVLTLRGNYTDFTNTIITRYPETFQLSGVAGHYDLNGNEPTVTVTNATAYNDPANWVNRNSTASYIRDQYLHDKVTSLKADFAQNTFASARGFGIVAGGSWTRLDRSYDQNQSNYLLPKGTKLLLSQVITPGVTMANNAAVKMNWDAFWSYLKTNGTATYDAALSSDYRLVEDVIAGHAALYWSRGGFRAIAGVRYEATHDDVHTGDVVNGVATPTARTHRYGNWMPNIQATYDVTRRLRVQAAVTKTIGRPDFADFAPGRTQTLDTNGNPVIKGTNPNLDPRVSTNYDASLEYYLPDGLVSLAVFHKDLAHETFTEQTQTLDATGLVVLTQQMPLNTGSARVSGIEASVVKRRLSFLPAPFDGLGFRGNFTYLDGRWNVVFTDGSTRGVGGLRNQPKWLGNVGVSYTAGPANINLDWRARGGTFTGTFGTTAVGDVWIKGSDTLDLQANVRVLRGIQLTFEARNLTDSYTIQTTGATNAIYNSVGAGRSFFGGFKFKY
ncbi:TonB-dependent receptor [Sphingomonas sp. PL20]|uniref:TonB-dependent receptor n=1 Tax=Sphingomonas sp. PL20 TaxID=2760712 RepID=UPI002FEEA73D